MPTQKKKMLPTDQKNEFKKDSISLYEVDRSGNQISKVRFNCIVDIVKKKKKKPQQVGK